MRYPIWILIPIPLLATGWPDQVTRGKLLYDQGHYREAVVEYERALPLAGSPLYRAVTLHRLALAHSKLAELRPAEECYKAELAIFRLGGDSPKFAIALAGLGEVYRAEGLLNEGLETERNALAMLKRLGMLEAEESATVQSIIGEILYDQRRFKAAQRSIRRALSILEEKLPPDSTDLASVLNNLGVVSAERKQRDQAESLLRRALAIRESRFGTDHPLVANTLLSLSSVYLEEERFTEARQACTAALRTMEHFYPGTHPERIKAVAALAVIERRQGNPAAAIQVLATAIREMGQPPAVTTPEYRKLLQLYARYLSDAGESDSARKVQLEARRLAEQSGQSSGLHSTVTLGELEAGGAH